MSLFAKAFAAPAVLAAVSLAAMPAEAAVFPAATHRPADTVSRYGGFGIGGGWGWGGGYRGRHHRRDRGVDAGDVLAGVLILGTIAAVANAATRANRERRPYPERYPDPDHRYDNRGYDSPRSGPQGLDGAADLCLREIERDARVREVTRVERSASGWLVTGALADGSGFSCAIGADGRIDRVDVGGRAQGYGADVAGAVEDRQYDDDYYRSARARADGQEASTASPAYPGGPLPGEEIDEDLPSEG